MAERDKKTMKKFRKNVAISIDGGGIKGVAAARALIDLEAELLKSGKSFVDTFRLVAGTSTGAIIAACVASGVKAEKIFDLYTSLGGSVFKKNPLLRPWPFCSHRYTNKVLEQQLKGLIGDRKMNDLCRGDRPIDLVITINDILENRTRFIKPWNGPTEKELRIAEETKKEEVDFTEWSVVKAVLASSAVPSLFLPIDGRYADGGFGAYGNPCYYAAFELAYCLGWKAKDTTLISMGTGREKPIEEIPKTAFGWIMPIIDSFRQSSNDQQVFLVQNFFKELDFRRFQVDIEEYIKLDDASPKNIGLLVEYGKKLGRKIVENDWVKRVPIQHPGGECSGLK
jgi:hypothetical protein